MPQRKGSHPVGLVRVLRRFVDWCKRHPAPVAVGIVVVGLTTLLSLAQSVDWLRTQFWPAEPQVIDFAPYYPPEIAEQGSQWTVRIENPLDASLIVTRATIRAAQSLPGGGPYTPSANLLRPTASYTVPISCQRRSLTVTLDPPLKLDPKDIAEIVFKAPLGRYPCRLFVSFETSRGRTAERQATAS